MGFSLFFTLDGLVFFPPSSSSRRFPMPGSYLFSLSLSLLYFCCWVSLSSLTVLIRSVCANLCIDLFMKRGLLLCERTAWATQTGCLQGEVMLPWSVVRRQALTWCTLSISRLLEPRWATPTSHRNVQEEDWRWITAAGSLLIPLEIS